PLQRGHRRSLFVAEVPSGKAPSAGKNLNRDRASGLEADAVDADLEDHGNFPTDEGDSELRPRALCPDPDHIRVSPAVSETCKVIHVRELDPTIGRNVKASSAVSTPCAPVQLPTHERMKNGRSKRPVSIRPDRRSPHARMRRRVTAFEVRKDVRIPERRSTV